MEQAKVRKKEHLDKLLKDFNSPERWERTISKTQEEICESKVFENREFLIQKYMAKFPQTKEIPLDDNKVIRL